MQSTDKKRFAALLVGLCDYYQRASLDSPVIAIYWDGLSGYDYEEISSAARAHMADPQHGDYFPKIADFMRHLKSAKPSSHPGADEAWAMCVRMTGEEDTAVITGQMREAWAIAWPVMELGDDVGARMAFKDAYARQIAMAAGAPVWEIQIGTNRELRAQRVTEAVRLGRLPAAMLDVHALPAPTNGVAGLLENAKERLSADDQRKLWAALRRTLVVSDDRDEKAAEREKVRQEFEAKRAGQLAKVAEKLKGAA